ncbi:MAG: hypothetical protein ACSHYB_05735 [Roseibacillus sp.]
MKTIVLVPALLLGLVSVSCRKQPAEVDISQTRVLTTHDEEPAVNATSAEQFLPPEILAQIEGSGQKIDGGEGDAKSSSPWTYQMPAADWKVAEKKPMRDVNLTFGEGETQGEVYLSVVGGGIQPNVDRWFRQFGSATKSLTEMGQLDFIGKKGYLVETAGRYEPGMGRPGKDGQALLGAIVENEGRLVTVKMIGAEAEIASRREQFIKFVASLQRN